MSLQAAPRITSCEAASCSSASPSHLAAGIEPGTHHERHGGHCRTGVAGELDHVRAAILHAPIAHGTQELRQRIAERDDGRRREKVRKGTHGGHRSTDPLPSLP